MESAVLDLESIENVLRKVLQESQGTKSEVTFAEYFEHHYWSFYCNSKKRKRLEYDLQCFNVILRYTYFSEKKLVEINTNDVQQVLYSIMNDRVLKGSTTNRYRAKLSAAD